MRLREYYNLLISVTLEPKTWSSVEREAWKSAFTGK